MINLRNINLPVKVFAISLGVSLLVALVVFFAMRGRNGGHYEDAIAEFPRLENIAHQMPIITPPEDEPYYYEEEYDEEPEDFGPRSILTGLSLYEYYVNRRPIAVVINNIRRALPQSGIASADIIYEVLSEGDVTRLVGIFQSYIPNKIGPVRSTRDYFVDFALNHDAIFIHHGGSETGYARIRSTGITALDGMNLEGSVFWRDRTYPSWHFNTGTRPLEHSSYAGWSRIYTHMESREIRDYIGNNPAYGFNFGELPENIRSLGTAGRVVVPFTTGNPRIFVFDPEYGHYRVENRDGAHVDAANREQVTVANILIQLTPMRVIDAIGRRNVDTVGEGSGYLVTGGEYFPVRWAKSSHTAPMRWYFEDGTPMIMPPGRTWINVFQSTGEVVFE